jgi:hypothetical protein
MKSNTLTENNIVLWPVAPSYPKTGKLYFWDSKVAEFAYENLNPNGVFSSLRQSFIQEMDVVMFLTEPLPERKDSKTFYRKILTQDAKVLYIYWDSFTSNRFQPLIES